MPRKHIKVAEEGVEGLAPHARDTHVPCKHAEEAVLCLQGAQPDEAAARLDAGFQLLRQCHALHKAWPPAPAEGPPPSPAPADALLLRCWQRACEPLSAFLLCYALTFVIGVTLVKGMLLTTSSGQSLASLCVPFVPCALCTRAVCAITQK